MTRFLAEQLSTAHWFDQRETRNFLNWTPAVSLDEGLAKLAEYYVRTPVTSGRSWAGAGRRGRCRTNGS
jgi:2-alkyl-3-oxoalkanoate reductase